MNLRAARNELAEPPKVRVMVLLCEAVSVVAFTYLLVTLFN